jgi:lantibiotic transport system permease protein
VRSFLGSLAGALSAETLKLRRTLALRMTLVTPAVVVILCVLQFGLTKMKLGNGNPEVAWRAFAGASFALWAFLMMPLFVTLEAALLAGLEHSDRQWKHLLALPVPRSAHYLAKWAALAGLLFGTAVIFTGLIGLGGWILMHIRPEAGLAGWPPWGWLLRRCTGMVTAALFMAAIQLWVAIRWSSFTIAVAAGMSATVAGFMIGQSRFGHWYPWTMPVQLFARDGGHATFAVLVSVLGAAAVLALSLWEFSRRELE